MKTTRTYSVEFQAKVASEVIRADLTLAEPAPKHGVPHTIIASWKRQAIDGMTGTFPIRGYAAKAASHSQRQSSGGFPAG